ncbi:hypothetical protein GWR56_16860 [Mucilaginibacter sp. 14171R-50]|uniref:hypothetical protein n=1 Tax=Mucilaginibacter sp. 14171R-50 TaxID=2703789 RepID=UPI00138D7EDE|nr:hypothetical protein [Mucilaginibacter sp. 14171R-50]QHS57125.1 hypothetical protein GWR56_16860 [Mucilaginibacter sp. 14171R-50]
MQSSKDNGGSSHIRYGHSHYPRVMDVICPYCCKKSALKYIGIPDNVEHFLDIDYQIKDLLFTCDHCLKRKTIDNSNIKNFELFNKIEIRGELIWAWNSNHLDYLIEVLSGNERPSHKWAFFRTYIHKKWFAKTKNDSDIKKLERLRHK